jgi:hypothetical protein
VLNQLHDIGHGQALLEAEGPHRRPAPVPRPRTQPARRRHRRTGAVDRLPAMAFPHARHGPAAQPDPQGLPQHRMPRRRAGPRRRGLRARTSGHPRHALGWPHDEEAPGHRRRRARRNRARAAGALPQPAPAEWPAADVVVGNPPFIGAKTMRAALGDGYVDALRGVAGRARVGRLRHVLVAPRRATRRARPALALRLHHHQQPAQTFNRRVVQARSMPACTWTLRFPTIPWVDSTDGAAVRIAMTVAAPGVGDGPAAEVSVRARRQGRRVWTWNWREQRKDSCRFESRR